jgi:protein gp37
MGASTTIGWCERTWNYLRGCSRKSAGCIFCYAEQMAGRFSGPGQPYEGLAYMKDGRGHWTGKIAAVPAHLEDPLRWQRPSMIFTNSMSDLFHEDLEINAIINSFEIMELADWHIYQTLTKRPERMPEILSSITLRSGRNLKKDPLKNVWIGTTIEDDRVAESRAKALGETPAAIRWVSFEPLIGNMDWRRVLRLSKANWAVFGGESKQGSDKPREMEVSWVREGLEACREMNISVYIKQLGWTWASKYLHPGKFRADPKGKKMECWPSDLRVQEWPIDIKSTLAWDGKYRKNSGTIPLDVVSVVAA